MRGSLLFSAPNNKNSNNNINNITMNPPQVSSPFSMNPPPKKGNDVVTAFLCSVGNPTLPIALITVSSTLDVHGRCYPDSFR